MITYEQFLAEIKTLNAAVSTSLSHSGSKSGSFITETWTTGGKSGGDCWSDSHHPVPADCEPDFEDFDIILEHYVPDIGHLAYKRLVRELVHLSDYTRREYYGNYYTQAEKWVDLAQMYKALCHERGSSLNNGIELEWTPPIEEERHDSQPPKTPNVKSVLRQDKSQK